MITFSKYRKLTLILVFFLILCGIILTNYPFRAHISGELTWRKATINGTNYYIITSPEEEYIHNPMAPITFLSIEKRNRSILIRKIYYINLFALLKDEPHENFFPIIVSETFIQNLLGKKMEDNFFYDDGNRIVRINQATKNF